MHGTLRIAILEAVSGHALFSEIDVFVDSSILGLWICIRALAESRLQSEAEQLMAPLEADRYQHCSSPLGQENIAFGTRPEAMRIPSGIQAKVPSRIQRPGASPDLVEFRVRATT